MVHSPTENTNMPRFSPSKTSAFCHSWGEVPVSVKGARFIGGRGRGLGGGLSLVRIGTFSTAPIVVSCRQRALEFCLFLIKFTVNFE